MRRVMIKKRATKIITIVMIEEIEIVIEVTEIDAEIGIEIEIADILEMIDRKIDIETIDPVIIKKKIVQDQDLDRETELHLLFEQ